MILDKLGVLKHQGRERCEVEEGGCVERRDVANQEVLANQDGVLRVYDTLVAHGTVGDLLRRGRRVGHENITRRSHCEYDSARRRVKVKERTVNDLHVLVVVWVDRDQCVTKVNEVVHILNLTRLYDLWPKEVINASIRTEDEWFVAKKGKRLCILLEWVHKHLLTLLLTKRYFEKAIADLYFA